jgi:hypothetical protein
MIQGINALRPLCPTNQVGSEPLLTILPGNAWRRAFGPYWVVAVGPVSNATQLYEWAIVSGGAPAFPAPGGKCTSLPPVRGEGGGGDRREGGMGAARNVSDGMARGSGDGATGEGARNASAGGRPLGSRPPQFDTGGAGLKGRMALHGDTGMASGGPAGVSRTGKPWVFPQPASLARRPVALLAPPRGPRRDSNHAGCRQGCASKQGQALGMGWGVRQGACAPA